jgi:hypothetical protein
MNAYDRIEKPYDSNLTLSFLLIIRFTIQLIIASYVSGLFIAIVKGQSDGFISFGFMLFTVPVALKLVKNLQEAPLPYDMDDISKLALWYSPFLVASQAVDCTVRELLNSLNSTVPLESFIVSVFLRYLPVAAWVVILLSGPISKRKSAETTNNKGKEASIEKSSDARPVIIIGAGVAGDTCLTSS